MIVVLFDGDKQMVVKGGTRWDVIEDMLYIQDEGNHLLAQFRDWIGIIDVPDEDEDE